MLLGQLRREPVRRVLLKQLYFTGNQAVWIMLLIGVALGGMVILLLHGQYGQSREAALRLLATLSFRDISPLLAALVLIARSSSAVASELAAMKVHGELDSLAAIGIPLPAYIVLPRVIGVSISSALLGLYLASASLVGGALASSGWEIGYQAQRIDQVLQLGVVLQCLGKSLLFGMAAATLACWSGLRAAPYVTEIPKASSSAVMRGLLAVFSINLIWVLLS
ncbi:ABC transporter permease [Jeongeupia sp. HS-3]|uniref:ABC transporter permease n=1 Tax=Jeongeupia sp. HS-3 TaxID=1009682 RepID=UPI0018A478D6|nr:ABC transporter permease [Jeongeupia sp. HS-3]BCL75171.1 ABC transporter permease [Jeongeupia sp. HS-3]